MSKIATDKPAVTIRFPGSLEYVPSARKFIAEMIESRGFGSKFSYRTEIIVDEICTNAVHYGCRAIDAKIELSCYIYRNRIELSVTDEGGEKTHIDRLRVAVSREKGRTYEMLDSGGLGLEIVHLLSQKIELEIRDEDLTAIRVVRKRHIDP